MAEWVEPTAHEAIKRVLAVSQHEMHRFRAVDEDGQTNSGKTIYRYIRDDGRVFAPAKWLPARMLQPGSYGVPSYVFMEEI